MEWAELASLEVLQSLEPASVARTEALGSALDFTPAVPVVRNLVEFFQLFPRDAVASLPDGQVTALKSYSDACWGTIQQMLSFDPNGPNPASDRAQIISQIQAQYGDAVTNLAPSVAFITASQRRSSPANEQLGAYVEQARQRVEELDQIGADTSERSKAILEEVRRISAESGVSQQATYFGDQAGKHADLAVSWQHNTNMIAGALILFAFATWLLGFWLVPVNNYQAIQWGLSKVLIFSTIAFLLYLSARTLTAHRHNEVVNRHRQNALLTFNSLADAANKPETRDVVLTHAAACIYAPQDSGFSKPSARQSAGSLIEVVPKIMGAEHLGG